jgi:Palmitoyl protein thioesterase
MVPFLHVLCLALAPCQEAAPRLYFQQVAPAHAVEQPMIRSKGQTRAVVVMQEFAASRKGKPGNEWHAYQQAGSTLVKHISTQADVFALAYEQTVAVSAIAGSAEFRQCIQSLKDTGYTEIVLVGFATGGLVARQYVEDEPKAGVTKVIQIGAMNQGLRANSGQNALQKSLSRQARHDFFRERLDKKIPEGVEFVCVVDTGWVEGNWLGKGEEWSLSTQWPRDLQAQGIPANVLTTKYLWSSWADEGARVIAELIKEEQPRWEPKQVETTRKSLIHLIDRPDGA